MAKVTIVKRDGSEVELNADNGVTVMEAIRDNGIDELLALCGGCCSCATCHVYVESDAAGALPPVTDDESDLLDSSEHRRENSRLSCQLPVSDAIDGLRVIIAPED